MAVALECGYGVTCRDDDDVFLILGDKVVHAHCEQQYEIMRNGPYDRDGVSYFLCSFCMEEYRTDREAVPGYGDTYECSWCYQMHR